MARRTFYAACLGALLCLAGCKCMFGGRGLPPDPLFANRKPIESKAITGPPTAPPSDEPAPPMNPHVADRFPNP